VTLPDGVGALGLTAMTKSGIEYTYSFCNTTQSGTYNVNGYGDAGGAMTKWNYVFEVTPSGGAESNTAFFLILIAISLGLLLLGFTFHNYIFSFIAGLSFAITGVYGMIYGYGDVTNLYSRMMSYIIIGIGMIITVVSAFEFAGASEGGKSNEGED
jgi:hypothetical protein